jgi:hypothetical protein
MTTKICITNDWSYSITELIHINDNCGKVNEISMLDFDPLKIQIENIKTINFINLKSNVKIACTPKHPHTIGLFINDMKKLTYTTLGSDLIISFHLNIDKTIKKLFIKIFELFKIKYNE